VIEDVQTPTILVVDDESTIREVLAVLLTTLGKVELVESGEEALQKLESSLPDLILLDVNMPGMDGYDVCRRLKGNPVTASIPVIFLTALDTNESEEQGLEMGATDFIRKPFSPRIVLARVSNVLKLQAANRQLKRMATTDSLTGAFNHRHFLDMGNKELRRSKRYPHAVSLLMIDFDHFKSVNDNYGHGGGTDTLIQVVAAMHSKLRAEDILARIGGEEFAVILPETSVAGATQLAERLRCIVSEMVVESSGQQLSVTISIGVAECRAEESHIDETLRRADEALYKAKELGRDRVVAV
jgi:diguanylate cyclase (GGDEF)-like protein